MLQANENHINVEILSQFINHLPQSVAIFDTEMRYLLANERWLKDYNLKSDDIIGVSHYTIFPEIGDEWKAIHKRCLAGDVDINERAEFPRADGTTDWIRWEVRPWYTDDGKAVGGLMMYTEVITAQVEFELQLNAQKIELYDANNRLEVLLNNAPVILFALDMDGVFTFSSGKGLAALDLKPGEVVGMNVFDIYAGNDLVVDTVRQALDGKLSAAQTEVNGRYFYNEYAPLYDQAGNLLGAIGVAMDITPQVEADAKLHEQQQAVVEAKDRLQAVIDNAPLIVFEMDKNGKVLYSDGKGLEKVDLKPGELVGQNAFDLYAFDPEITRLLKLAVSGKPVSASISHLGDLHYLNHYVVRRDEAGEVSSTIGVAIDITEQYEADEARRQSEARNKAMLQAIPDLMFMFDRAGVYTDVKESDQLVAPREELIGQSLHDVLPDHADMFISLFQGVLDTGKGKIIEYAIDTPIGTIDYESRIFKVDDSEVVMIARDVSELKEAEREREVLLERTRWLFNLSLALNEVEDYQMLLEVVQSISYAHGATSGAYFEIITDDNDVPYELELIARHRLDGKQTLAIGTRFDARTLPLPPIWVENPNVPLLVSNIEEDDRIDPVMRKAQQELGNAAFVFLPLYQAGRWVGAFAFNWLEPHDFIEDEVEMYNALPALTAPVAENRRLLQSMRETVRELNESLLFKDQFLATMSHELRTPMNAITGYSSIALTFPDLDPKVHRMMDRIKVNADRMINLINDILDISRINAGRTQIVKEPFDLEALTRGWSEDFRKQAADKGLSLNFDYDRSLPAQLVGDEERLTQIAGNLLANAIKFTLDGYVALTVRRSPEDETYWQIIVKDSGIGISETWHHLIFEEFRQVEMGSSRKHGGAGLGLSIVQKLCILMGGKVTLSSVIDEGSTFTVTLPIQTELAETT